MNFVNSLLSLFFNYSFINFFFLPFRVLSLITGTSTGTKETTWLKIKHGTRYGVLVLARNTVRDTKFGKEEKMWFLQQKGNNFQNNN